MRLYPCAAVCLNREVTRCGILLRWTAAVAAMFVVPTACSADRATTAAAVGAVPHFVDDTDASGIDHSYDGGFEFFVGGGVATFDCDADGRPDLYFAGGTGPAALYHNRSAVGGALAFEQVTSTVTDLTDVTGAYPIDVDSDRNADLVVLRRGGNVLLRGLGDCQFETANDRFTLGGGEAWTTAFSATWEGANALPTMAFGNYLIGDTFDCDSSQLVRPSTPGTGYGSPIPLAPGHCALSMLFSDWGRTGQRDLRVTNDRHYYTSGAEQLWKVEPDASPVEYTDADGWQRLQIWGMGIASRDVTGDGVPEVFLTSQGDNKLQTLEPGAAPTYRDIALRRGVTAQRPYAGGDILPSTAWHPGFGDVNNDGVVDLFVTKGNVDAQADHAARDPNNLFIGQAGGTFVEGAPEAGIVRYGKSRGAAVADLNMDGLLDLVVVERAANVQLWRNTGSGDAQRTTVPRGHWLSVSLHQAAPNVDAIGAWLDVKVGERTISREVTVGGGHASGELGWLHTGLGSATTVEVRVQWPDGELGPWIKVGADQFVTITRGAAEAAPFTFAAPG